MHHGMKNNNASLACSHKVYTSCIELIYTQLNTHAHSRTLFSPNTIVHLCTHSTQPHTQWLNTLLSLVYLPLIRTTTFPLVEHTPHHMATFVGGTEGGGWGDVRGGGVGVVGGVCGVGQSGRGVRQVLNLTWHSADPASKAASGYYS